MLPFGHASVVLKTPKGMIYVDPVGNPDRYLGLDKPDFILITHHHGDHFDAATLFAVAGEKTTMMVNPEVTAKLPDDLKPKATVLANGESGDWNGIGIEAIPAYNIS